MEPNFLSYISNQRYHVIVARRLLSDAGILTTKEFYTLEDASKIQDLINVRFGPHQIRIVIFSAENQNKIIWKGWNGGLQNSIFAYITCKTISRFYLHQRLY